MRKIFCLSFLIALAIPFGIASAEYAESLKIDTAKIKRTPSGLGYIVTKKGEGAQPKAGDRIQVHYTGWLTNGTSFDSSVKRGRPFEFNLGRGRVIKAWDEGLAMMKVGGKRMLIIPAKLGYGSRGSGAIIPPNSELVFEVELVGIR